jgi:hypothetical protein
MYTLDRSIFYDYQYQPDQDMKKHIAEVKNLAHLLGDCDKDCLHGIHTIVFKYIT